MLEQTDDVGIWSWAVAQFACCAPRNEKEKDGKDWKKPRVESLCLKI